jgi:hypothetical protein
MDGKSTHRLSITFLFPGLHCGCQRHRPLMFLEVSTLNELFASFDVTLYLN